MIYILLAIAFTIAGAVFIRKANYELNDVTAFSIFGYIAFIISFAFLEYVLMGETTLSFVFGIWAAGTVLITTLIGKIFYGEETTFKNIFFSLITLIGLIGFALS